MIEKVTYEEVVKAREAKERAIREYHSKFYDYLFDCRKEAGLDKRVRVKATGDVGGLQIDSRSWSFFTPFEYRFYPVKKDGNLSMKSRYVSGLHCRDEYIPKMLLEVFEPVGDSNEN